MKNIRLMLAAACLLLPLALGACQKEEAAVAVDVPVPVPTTNDDNAWNAYLSDVVRRNNRASLDENEAATALRAIHRMTLPGARAFLSSVLSERRGLCKAYRRPLRRIAKRILEGRVATG